MMDLIPTNNFRLYEGIMNIAEKSECGPANAESILKEEGAVMGEKGNFWVRREIFRIENTAFFSIVTFWNLGEFCFLGKKSEKYCIKKRTVYLKSYNNALRFARDFFHIEKTKVPFILIHKS